MLGRAELAILPGGLQLAQHVLVEIALHILVFDVMRIKVFEPRHDALQDFRRRDDEGGIGHECRKRISFLSGLIRKRNEFPACIKVRKVSILHVLDGRKSEVADDVKDILWAPVLEMAPPHRLPYRTLRKNVVAGKSHGILQPLRLHLLHVERADKHKVRQLFDDRQRICNTACPNACPDGIDFILDGSCDHNRSFENGGDTLPAASFSLLYLL
ncbi:Uncharacterised protein [Bacteroides xylanisolvens]|nr:Uncharacterised protein [Bacteroides xylanisolvens]